jgi:hypothetical protein
MSVGRLRHVPICTGWLAFPCISSLDPAIKITDPKSFKENSVVARLSLFSIKRQNIL